MESRLKELVPTLTADTLAGMEPQTPAGKARAETIARLRRDGHIADWWAAKAHMEADRPIPSKALQDSQLGAWVMVWSRPRRADWTQRADGFDQLLEDYDRLEARNQHFADQRREREVAQAAQEREAEAIETARREQESEALKAQLRTVYLRLPGTTPAQFELHFPTLLADHRRREMDQHGDELRQELRRAALRGMNEVD